MLRRYNPAVPNRPSMRLVLAVLLAAALLGAAGLSSCDYPEEGYYSLTGYDAQGNAVVHHPFQVEELVDDTELTYGYALHLYDPEHKTVYDIPIDNSPDLSRRGWLLGISQADYGHGDLALDMTHVDHISFVGAWREQAGSKAVPIAGDVQSTDDPQPSPVTFSSARPEFGGTERHAVRFEVDTLTEKQFTALIGGPAKGFKHIKGTKPQGLDPELGRAAGARQSSGVVQPAGE
jgi:hypothetical protein